MAAHGSFLAVIFKPQGACTRVKFQKNMKNRAVAHAGRAQAAIIFIVFSAAGELGFDRAFDQRQRRLLRQGGGSQRTGDY